MICCESVGPKENKQQVVILRPHGRLRVYVTEAPWMEIRDRLMLTTSRHAQQDTWYRVLQSDSHIGARCFGGA